MARRQHVLPWSLLLFLLLAFASSAVLDAKSIDSLKTNIIPLRDLFRSLLSGETSSECEPEFSCRGAINRCPRNHDSADYKTHFVESCFGTKFPIRAKLARFEIGTQFKHGCRSSQLGRARLEEVYIRRTRVM